MGIPLNSSFDRGAGVPIDSSLILVDLADLLTFPDGLRYEGMQVYVEEDASNWQLQGGIDDADWVELGSDPNAVVGPALNDDSTIPVWDGVDSRTVRNTAVTIDMDDKMSGLTGLESTGNLRSTGALRADSQWFKNIETDSATTGSNATLPEPTAPVVRLTNIYLVSISMIANSADNGREITYINSTGRSITINNNSGATAGRRILTGTKASYTVLDEGQFTVRLDTTEGRWMLQTGGGSGPKSLSTAFQILTPDVALWRAGDDTVYLGGGTLAGSLVDNTTNPIQGGYDRKYTQSSGSLNDWFACPPILIENRFKNSVNTLVFPYTSDHNDDDIQCIVYDESTFAVIDSFFMKKSTGITIQKRNFYLPDVAGGISVGFHVKTLNNGKIFRFGALELTSDQTTYANIPQGNIGELAWLPTAIAPFGFIPVTNVTIGSSGATYNGPDYFNLYQMLWSMAGLSTTAGDTFRISSAKGASASADWAAAKTISIDFQTNEVFVRQGGVSRNLGSYQADEIISHVHAEYASGGGGGGPYVTGFANKGTAYSNGTGATGGAETRPKNVALNGFIRYQQGTASNTLVTTVETFSTDTVPLNYAPSSVYTLSSLMNAPIGTIISWATTINTNTHVQTTTAPTQTVSDMAANGIQMFPRANNAASNAGSPARIAIQVGKGMRGVTVTLYKNTGKSVGGEVSFIFYPTTQQAGFILNTYDATSGVLLLDCSTTVASAITSNIFIFNDTTSASSGYVVINAAKNPALTGLNINAVAVSAESTSGQSIPTSTLTTVTYTSKEYDTHSALNAATGVWTCQETGYYWAEGAVYFQGGTYAVGNQIYCLLKKVSAGVTKYYYGQLITADRAALTEVGSVVSKGMFLMKGDTVELQTSNNKSTATLLSTFQGGTHFSIHKTSVG